MMMRLEGAALLTLCALALRQIHLLVHAAPAHAPTPVELALGLAAVLTGVGGAAFLLVGPPLLRPYAWPPAERD